MKSELPGDWAVEAACAHVDSDLFFPATADYEPALRVCEGCEVRAECLAHALTQNESEGVWGGATPVQRKTMKRRIQKDNQAERRRRANTMLAPRWPKANIKNHGTRSGYVGGCRCEDCTTANRVWEREQRVRVKRDRGTVREAPLAGVGLDRERE